jgi:hypothetical protein
MAKKRKGKKSHAIKRQTALPAQNYASSKRKLDIVETAAIVTAIGTAVSAAAAVASAIMSAMKP